MNCPRRSPRISPAFSSTDRCLETEGLEISKRSEISPAVRSVADRYARILRRTVEDRASNTLSSDMNKFLFSLLTNYLTWRDNLVVELTIQQRSRVMMVWTYLVYVVISLAATIWVGRSLHHNGRVFL